MKQYLNKLIPVVLFFGLLSGSAHAQSKKEIKAKAKAKHVTELINKKRFAFKVQTVQPMRGGNINNQNFLGYEMVMKKDTLISYLPYFGRAFTAPMDPRESPLNFNTTEFEYAVEKGKRGNKEIKITPKNRSNYSRQFYLSIGESGYGTLQVTAINREPISYSGYITSID